MVVLWCMLPVALLVYVNLTEEVMVRENNDVNISGSLRYRSVWMYGATHTTPHLNWELQWITMRRIRANLSKRYPQAVSNTDAAWNAFSNSLKSNGEVDWQTANRMLRAANSLTYRISNEIKQQHQRADILFLLGIVTTLISSVFGGILIFLQSRALREQAASDERFRLLFEQSSDAHLLFDDTGIIDCNLAAIRMLHCTDKQHLLALHPAVLSPEYQPDGTKSLEKCIEMDALARMNGHHRFEWYHQKIDGIIFPVEVTLTPVKILKKDALLVVWHDLTERIIAEEKVKQSEKMLRDMVENLPAGAIYVSGENILVNRAVEEITGYTRQELPTLQVWFDTLYKGNGGYVRNRYEIEKAAGFPESPVVTLIRKDGEIRHIQFAAYAYDGGEVWILHDISERIEATRALSESKVRLAEAQRIAHLGSYEVIFDTGEVIWSEEVYRLFERDLSLGSPTFEEVLQYLHPEDLADLNAAREEGCKTGEQYERDLRIRQKDGSYRWCRSTSKPILDEHGKPVRTIGTLLDVNERKLDQQRIESTNRWLEDANRKLLDQQEDTLLINSQLKEQMLLVNEQAAELEAKKQQLEEANDLLRALATIDGLTGIANHRAFQERLMEEWNHSSRYMEPFSVILLDVDNFKAYNDQFGHPEGDIVLRTVANLLKQSIRDVDFVARYGGEEFVVVLPQTDIEGACRVAERCRASLETAHWTHRKVTASFGVATQNINSKTAQELIDFADQALYATKRSGRNGVSHYQSLCVGILPETQDGESRQRD